MGDLDASLRDELAVVAAADRYRRRRVVEVIDPAIPTHIRVNGQACINFCSNDYLGLATHADIRRAMSAAAERYGVGSGAAHLVTGHSPEHHALEEELAEFVGREKALLFSTGHMANLGVASALLTRSDAVVEDRLNHASLLDAGLASGAQFTRYAHGNMNELQQKLVDSTARRKLVMSDGVFSMDGDIAPLNMLGNICQQQQAILMVDDAHGEGVLGRGGRGIVDHFGLHGKVDVEVGTLSKAFGVVGGVVALVVAWLLGRVLARRPWVWFLLLGLALPVRIPISVGGTDANLLVPLYAVIVLGLFTWLAIARGGERLWRGTPLDLPLLLFVVSLLMPLAGPRRAHAAQPRRPAAQQVVQLSPSA